MFVFTHEINQQTIQLTISAFGEEIVTLNKQVVSKGRRWGRESQHSFQLDGETVAIKVNQLSMTEFKVAVTIHVGEKLVFVESQERDPLADKAIVFSSEERNWKSEIEFPNTLLQTCWAFYMLLILSSVGQILEVPLLATITQVGLLGCLGYGCWEFGKSLYQGLFEPAVEEI